ncbi:SRPBCC family protein [Allonocardiopsis opalescens]|uniref:Uncharacterized protein YndB with AHSA1/START domain n=1 Tax=Allonocardiopsis opalescens TaxID=1144618 RepID=A0A2T0PZF6_9ACTN|nr:SRPBCC family protein [Allonocardiopsis opalescens]PRX96819.1 uncharacterized protein YndB with AHSA1/START domain [Allonocardiopsis opalescens]
MAENLGSVRRDGANRVVMRFERRLAHPPAKVWRALTDTGELAAWFPATVAFDATPGARLRFDLTPEAKRRLDIPSDLDTVSAGEITRSEPPHLLEYTWGEEVLRWELRPDGEGCVLVFTDTVVVDSGEVPDDPAYFAEAASAWHACLDALDALLAGRPGTVAAWDRAAELRGAYDRALA